MLSCLENLTQRRHECIELSHILVCDVLTVELIDHLDDASEFAICVTNSWHHKTVDFRATDTVVHLTLVVGCLLLSFVEINDFVVFDGSSSTTNIHW